MKNYDPMFEHFKSVYPDTISNQLILSQNNLDEVQAEKFAEMFAKMQGSMVIFFILLNSNTIQIYTSKQLKQDIDKMLKEKKVEHRARIDNHIYIFAIDSDKVIYSHGMACVRASCPELGYSGLYEVTSFKLIESEANDEEG